MVKWFGLSPKPTKVATFYYHMGIFCLPRPLTVFHVLESELILQLKPLPTYTTMNHMHDSRDSNQAEKLIIYRLCSAIF